MKKDKEAKDSSRWQQWQSRPNFLKKILIYSILILLFALSIVILSTRYRNAKMQQAAVSASDSESKAEPLLLENEIALQNDRLSKLEDLIKQQQITLQSAHQLIVLEILQEVLEGRLSLKNLTLYLQKNAEPWTVNTLNTLSPIKECKTYAQLELLLLLPPSSQPQPKSLSSLKRFKKFIKSLVRIRKLDQDGSSQQGTLHAIQTALREHNIQKALEAFNKFPPEEKKQLSSWKKEAQNRLVLETLKQKMLLELSGS
jgi:hypothetical protein